MNRSHWNWEERLELESGWGTGTQLAKALLEGLPHLQYPLISDFGEEHGFSV